jgi:hypothetical protein
VHDCAASVTVNVLPPIVSRPLSGDVVVFAAAENATVPLPDPELPDVTVSQLALELAVHAHPAAVVTPTVPVPPAADSDWLVPESV